MVAFRGHPHKVQFFSTHNALCLAVVAFAVEALESGDEVLLVLARAHLASVEKELARLVSVAPQCLLILDAETLLERFLVRGIPDVERFMEAVGTLVAPPGGPERGLSIYSELAGVLWSVGSDYAALETEGLWNTLLSAHPAALLCGYLVEDVSRFSKTPEFVKICAQHTHPKACQASI